MVRGDSVVFFVRISIGNSQEEVVSSILCTVCVCGRSMFLAAPKKILPTLLFPAGGSEAKGEDEEKIEDEMCDFIVWTLPCKDPSRFCWCFNNLWIMMLLLSVSFHPTVLPVHKPLAKIHKYKGEINRKCNAWISLQALSNSLLHGPQAEYIFAFI